MLQLNSKYHQITYVRKTTDMAENVKNLFAGIPLYMYLLLLLVFGLFVASFFLPPLGIIHPSVLQAGAIILGFCWLFYVSVNIPNFIQRGAHIKASYGNANITIGNEDEDKEVN